MKNPTKQDCPLSRTWLLATPINIKKTWRFLEFCAPVNLFAEIDEKGVYHLLGVPLPGHFQFGILSLQQKWTPSGDQDRSLWQEREERNGCLHSIHRDHQLQLEECIALVQHNPRTRKKERTHFSRISISSR